MRLLFYIFIILSNSCSSGSLEKQQDKLITQNYKEESQQSKGFKDFIDNFQEVYLPYDLTIGNKYWIDFHNNTNDSVISRDLVEKYLYEGSSEKYKNSPYGQFYYGIRIKINKNVIGVAFYGTAKEDNGINGYELVLFDSNGSKLDHLVVAGATGVFDTDMQLEAKIELNRITLNEIKLDLEKIEKLTRFKGMQRDMVYSISSEGKFEKISESPYQERVLTVNENNNYRIEIID